MRFNDPFTVLVLILVAFIVVTFSCCAYYDYVHCSAVADGLDMNFKYNPIIECMLEVEPEIWVPLENYRWQNK